MLGHPPSTGPLGSTQKHTRSFSCFCLDPRLLFPYFATHWPSPHPSHSATTEIALLGTWSKNICRFTIYGKPLALCTGRKEKPRAPADRVPCPSPHLLRRRAARHLRESRQNGACPSSFSGFVSHLDHSLYCCLYTLLDPLPVAPWAGSCQPVYVSHLPSSDGPIRYLWRETKNEGGRGRGAREN